MTPLQTTQLLTAIHDTPLGELMRSVPDLFPICETLHFVGLSLLVGAMLIVDLRIAGHLKQIEYAAVLKLLPVAIVGFLINLGTGVCFIATNPGLYWTNPAFAWKMAAIVAGGLNAAWFMIAEQNVLIALPIDGKAPLSARTMAIASMVIWVLVILLGRLLPTFAEAGGG